MKKKLFTLSLFLCCIALAEDKPEPQKNPLGFLNTKSSDEKLPTYIKSDELTVDSESRVFTYLGNVEVTQDDLLLTAEQIVGNYDQNNQITKLTAEKQVVITRGEEARAQGDYAVYDKLANTIVITKNPELQREGNVLTADKITLFLNDNRSEAEGNVRVKLIQKAGDKAVDIGSSIRGK